MATGDAAGRQGWRNNNEPMLLEVRNHPSWPGFALRRRTATGSHVLQQLFFLPTAVRHRAPEERLAIGTIHCTDDLVDPCRVLR